MSTTQQPPRPTGVIDAFEPALAAVRDTFAELVDTPVWSLDDVRLGSRLAEALAVKAAAEELAARMVGEAIDRGLPKRCGASSTRAHLMAAYRMSVGEASRTVRTAQAICGPSALTEPARRALAAGEVSAERATVVATAVDRFSPSIDPARVEAVQADLLDQAGRLVFPQLQHLANHAVEAVDPEGADSILGAQLEAQERAARASTELVLQIAPDGTGSGRFHHLPPLHTAILKKALEAEAAPRRDNPLIDDHTGQSAPHAIRMGLAFCALSNTSPSTLSLNMASPTPPSSSPSRREAARPDRGSLPRHRRHPLDLRGTPARLQRWHPPDRPVR